MAHKYRLIACNWQFVAVINNYGINAFRNSLPSLAVFQNCTQLFSLTLYVHINAFTSQGSKVIMHD